MACRRILAHKSPSDACPFLYDPEVMPRLPVVLALCTAAAVTGCGSEGGNSKPSSSSTGLPTATAPPSSATSSTVGPCTAAQLSGKTFAAGAEASQPFAQIVLTNGGPGPCGLSGYPALTAWGSTGHGPSTQLKTVLTKGSIYEVPDPGPTTVVIAPGRFAWFGVGTATAYESPLVSIDRVVIDVGSAAGGKASQVNVALSMTATSPLGRAVPITVTAFAPGVPAKL